MEHKIAPFAQFSYPKSWGGAAFVLGAGLACTNPARADVWTTPDKPVHLAGGCITTLIVADRRPELSAAAQWAIGTLPWVAKEALDATAGSTGWSWKDLAASALGAAACVPVGRFVFSHDGRRAAVTFRQEF